MVGAKRGRMSRAALASIAVFALVANACAAADGGEPESSNQDITQTPDAGPAAGASMADTVHWFRNSAEAKASYLQAYRLAAASLDHALAAPDAPAKGAWAVILDADETVLDNSEYQKERGAQGYSPDSWSAWVQRKEAKATPGSVAFTSYVRSRGGKVVIITNRSAADCPATDDNLRSDGFAYDAVLCQTDVSDKNPRFQKVKDGTAAPGIGPLQVVMWVGDNILDFPDMSQDARNDESKLADFGSRFIVLPNPMYGSWQKNPAE